jgi:glutamate dehydrogenase (NAD(P)+)
MKNAFDHVWRRYQELHVSLRDSAIAVGVERIAEAHEVRGLFP